MTSEQQAYIKMLYDKPIQLGLWLGFDDLTELHNEWIRSMAFNDTDETLLAHRGSFKTTCLALAMAIVMVVYPTRNIIFQRKTDTDVKEVMRQVAKVLHSDQMRHIAFKIWGADLTLTEETFFSLTTSLAKTTRGASQLQGLGIKGSITGKHADIIFTDDIVNVKDRVSRAEREEVKLHYQELQNVKNRGGRIFNCGTPWHKEDAISMMPNVHRHDCYETGLITKKQLDEIRASMTPSLFAANYELKHIANEDAMFDAPTFFSDIELLYNGISHVDAAYGGSDSTAFTIVHKEDDKYYVFGKLWKRHVDDCMDSIVELHKHYLAGKTYSEDNGDKGYMRKALKERGLHAVNYHEKQNKYIKIATHLKANWSSVYFHEETDPEYINQILDYTDHAEHDDAPDSLASAIRLMGTSIKASTFKGGL